MNHETLIYERHDGVAKITLHRPSSFNALDLKMAEELHDLLETVDEDDSIRALILTGAGEKAFCAGGDVKGMAESLKEDRTALFLRELTEVFHTAVSSLVRMRKPTVAAVNGVAAGAGVSLALACDLALASEAASFTMAYTRLAIIPDGSSTFFLPRLVGVRRALQLTLLNDVLSAEQAKEMGLVYRVVPAAELPADSMELTKKLAQGPTVAYGEAKALLYSSFAESLETQMELERRALARCGKTEDFREGVTAFVEKRAARYQGR